MHEDKGVKAPVHRRLPCATVPAWPGMVVTVPTPIPETERNHWLWVTRPEYWLEPDYETEREILDPRGGSHIWWTCHAKNQSGDLALIYRAGRVAGLGRDIAYLVETTTDAEPPAGLADRRLGYYWCDARPVHKFIQPITLADLRATARLEDWGALRANFQGTAFAISNDHWTRIIRVAIRKNPRFARSVQKVGRLPLGDNEAAIERWLVNHLDELRLFGYRGVRLYRDPHNRASGRQYRCGPVGRIDLLCEHGRSPKRYLVVEVKNVRADRETIAQAEAYQQWVHQHLRPHRGVDVLIVSRGATPAFEYGIRRRGTWKRVDIADLPRGPGL
jgi:EVE domain